jgi:hypothetical protein
MYLLVFRSAPAEAAVLILGVTVQSNEHGMDQLTHGSHLPYALKSTGDGPRSSLETVAG